MNSSEGVAQKAIFLTLEQFLPVSFGTPSSGKWNPPQILRWHAHPPNALCYVNDRTFISLIHNSEIVTDSECDRDGESWETGFLV